MQRRRTTYAARMVAVLAVLMLAGLVSPLLVRATGTTAYLETRPVDPRAMFRGDYVILSYAIGEEVGGAESLKQAKEKGKPLYVTITTVGYGDVYPVTFGGRVFTFFILLIGLGIVAVPTGLLASALSKAREEEQESISDNNQD